MVVGKKGISPAQARERRKEVKRSAAPPEPINDKKFEWSAADVDHEYTDGWDWELAPKEAADLLKLLEDTSQKTWQEVKNLKFNSKKRTRQLHHSQPIDSICKAAQARLIELQLDLEEVFRLRHGNKLRVWGHRQGSVFRIIWYDRHHNVCPRED